MVIICLMMVNKIMFIRPFWKKPFLCPRHKPFMSLWVNCRIDTNQSWNPFPPLQHLQPLSSPLTSTATVREGWQNHSWHRFSLLGASVQAPSKRQTLVLLLCSGGHIIGTRKLGPAVRLGGVRPPKQDSDTTPSFAPQDLRSRPEKNPHFGRKKTSSKPIFGVFDFNQTVFRAASLGDPGTLGPCLSVRKLLSTHHNSPRSEPQILSPSKNPAWWVPFSSPASCKSTFTRQIFPSNSDISRLSLPKNPSLRPTNLKIAAEGTFDLPKWAPNTSSEGTLEYHKDEDVHSKRPKTCPKNRGEKLTTTTTTTTRRLRSNFPGSHGSHIFLFAPLQPYDVGGQPGADDGHGGGGRGQNHAFSHCTAANLRHG